MNKKGFTLIELLAVIIILAIVALIATPIVLNVVEDAKKSAGQSEANMILEGIETYCEAEKMGFKNTKYCVDGLMKKEDIEKIINPGKATNINVTLKDGKVSALTLSSNGHDFQLNNGKMEESKSSKPGEKTLYKDKSGANIPELLDNMVPIKYDGSKWIYADTKEEWYDYNKKEWANAVVLSESGKSKTVGQEITEDDIDLWYVWIPRYKYQLFSATPANLNTPPEINVTFENELETTGNVTCTDNISTTAGATSETCTNADIGNYYTHPAFTVNKGTESIKEIKGIWVGKFEVSDPTNLDSNVENQTISKITIKPNVSSLRNQNISNFKTAIEKMQKDYSINGDTHMMRNMEWGAVAYLSQSKYGKGTIDININSSDLFLTGGGDNNTYKINTNQSTTQNIYGIYDMNGGAFEYVMSYVINSDEIFSPSSGLTNSPTQNYDKYSYNTESKNSKGGKLGDATKETKAWYEDSTYFPCSNDFSWFVRGGDYDCSANSGIFNFNSGDGFYINYFSYGYAFGLSSTRGVLSSQ